MLCVHVCVCEVVHVCCVYMCVGVRLCMCVVCVCEVVHVCCVYVWV